jgi:hypothetical protein
VKIQLLIFPDNTKILTQAQDLEPQEIGDPDWLLIEPFEVKDELTLEPWLLQYTTQNKFKIHSDKVLTIVDPNPLLKQKYEQILKGENAQ